MARDSGPSRERAATASSQAHAIEKGWSVYDSLDRPIGNVTDVGETSLSVDGRPEGLGFFDVPLDAVRSAGDGDVHLSRPMEELVEGAAPFSRTGTSVSEPVAPKPEDTGRRPTARSETASAGTAAEHDQIDASSYTASGTPVGLGSNTPVGNEPTTYRRWDQDVEPSWWSHYRTWVLPVGASAATAAGYVWWRRRQAPRTPIERVTDAFAKAGESVEPVWGAARERHPAWLLAPLAALPLLYLLRSSQDASTMESQAVRLRDGDYWRNWLTSAATARASGQDVGGMLTDRAAAIKGRLQSATLPTPKGEQPSWLWFAGVPALIAAAVAAWWAGREGRRTEASSKRVGDIMTRGAQVIRPDGTVFEAASLMRQLDVGALPVCDGRRLRGMLTDRDIVVRVLADGRDPHLTNVQDVMSSELVYAFEDDPVTQAARLMREHQIRRVPIVDRDKNLVGIVSLGDLAVDAGRDELSGETLEKISEPARPRR
jgi:CBS domain-containing protein